MDQDIILPQITVLMPVFNAEKYLKEAIDSILAQSYTNFEFLIIDDASTDRSPQIIASYEDSRIRCIHNTKNLGVAFSLNIGIGHSRGKYTARMDADDISKPDRLQLQYEYMEKHPEVIACGTRYKLMGTSRIKNLPTDNESIKISLFSGINPIAHPTVFLRKANLTKHNLTYNENVKYGQDFDFWSRIVKYGKVINLPDILYEIRLHNAQVTQKHPQYHKEVVKKTCLCQLDLLNILPSEEEKQLHTSFINSTPSKNLNEMKNALIWLKNLENSNRKCKNFDIHLFNSLLDFWRVQKFNNYFVKKNFSPYNIIELYHPKLKLYQHIPFRNQIKIIIKSLILFRSNNLCTLLI